MVRYILFSSLIAALAFSIGVSLQSAPAQTPATPANSDVLPDGPGKSGVEKDCLSCHGVRMLSSRSGTGTPDEWNETVNKMVSQGADVSDDDFDVLIKYLAKNFGPDMKTGDASKPSGSTPPPASSDKTPPAGGSGSDASKGSSAPINVNSAGAQDLQAALGLSQAEADSIVQYRKDHGNFKTWQDVAAVPGVSSDKIKQNQQRLSF